MSLIHDALRLRDEVSALSPDSIGRNEAEQRIAQLTSILTQLAYHYYVLDDPLITDPEYDLLFRFLQELEDRFPDLRRPESPTHRVGGTPLDAFEKVRHPETLLSLGNAFGEKDLRSWYARCVRGLMAAGVDDDQPPLTVELKIDGIALALTYDNGQLAVGATRGNGSEGENVTAQVKTIRGLPLRVPVPGGSADHLPARIEVRGESYMRLSDFERMNERLALRGDRTYANTRNSTAGSIRQLDPRVTASRPLRFYAYGTGPYDGGTVPSSQSEILAWLRQVGFPVNEHFERFDSIDDAVAYCQKWTDDRENLDYEIDGVVVKIDSLPYQDILGAVSNAPRWAVAYKFPAREATTRLLDIGINVGRTGAIKPFAILEPVHIGGVTVSRATLHNEDYIVGRDIRIGDMVTVKRAGDVIPQVLGPVVSERPPSTRKWSMPTSCPACGSATVRNEGDADYYCVSSTCPEQLVRLVEHFASRGALDIEGFGSKLAAQLVESGLVKSIPDIYRLELLELLSLDGFAQRKAENLLSGIETAKSRPLSRLLYGLGIRYVGATTSELLVERIGSMSELAGLSYDELRAIDQIGPEIAASLRAWFESETNRKTIEELEKLGVNLSRLDSEFVPVEVESPAAGKIFVLTGTLPNLSRAQATERIRRAGGRVVSNVSGSTDYVVIGESPGSKATRAEALGIARLNEEDLLMLLDQR